MDLDKVVKERTSVKKFNSQKPNWRNIIEAIDSARFAPMAGGNFTVKFILISNAEKIAQIAEAAQQPFVGTVHYLVVVCSNPARLVNSYGKQQGEIYGKQQAGAAIENFLLKLEALGLSTCWIGHFSETQVKRVLGIPENIQVEALFPIGFEYEKKRTKKAPVDLDSILYFDKWDQKKMNVPRKMDV